MGETSIQLAGGAIQEYSVSDVVAQVAKLKALMDSVLKVDQHYGVIPGTGSKPTLLKPGAEKINFMFRVGTGDLVEIIKDLPNGHKDITIKTPMIHIPTGQLLAYGIGSCSTMESKYRYRNIADFEDTGEPIPKDSKEHKQEYRKQGLGMKKINGMWAWVRYKDSSREENPDIADVYNTVLKMAAKRSYVDGTIKASAASDFFTQDVEDIVQGAAVEAEYTETTGEMGPETSGAPSQSEADERKALEAEIGRLATILGADSITAARTQVLKLREDTKAGTFDHAEHVNKLREFKISLEGLVADKGVM